jgi:hypothetical protein
MLRFIAKIGFTMVTCLVLMSSIARADTVEDTTTTTVSQSPTGEKVTKTVQVTRHIVTTPVPAPKDATTDAPVGFANCFTVESGWYNDVWIDRHRVCQYNDTQKEGEVWVAGYWGCTVATTQGICSTWQWTPGHWQKTLAVY